jgi:L-fuconolactonase
MLASTNDDGGSGKSSRSTEPAVAALSDGAGRPRRGVAPSFHIDEVWLAQCEEAVLEPSLPIIDPHHHVWVRSTSYPPEQLLADMRARHNSRATVYIEAGFAAPSSGGPRFAGVGEVEYANGIGALFASNYHGQIRACAGIVGKVDLTLGAGAEVVMQA